MATAIKEDIFISIIRSNHMKQTTLEDLFYGNINPNETSFVRGSEYGK